MHCARAAYASRSWRGFLRCACSCAVCGAPLTEAEPPCMHDTCMRQVMTGCLSIQLLLESLTKIKESCQTNGLPCRVVCALAVILMEASQLLGKACQDSAEVLPQALTQNIWYQPVLLEVYKPLLIMLTSTRHADTL